MRKRTWVFLGLGLATLSFPALLWRLVDDDRLARNAAKIEYNMSYQAVVDLFGAPTVAEIVEKNWAMRGWVSTAGNAEILFDEDNLVTWFAIDVRGQLSVWQRLKRFVGISVKDPPVKRYPESWVN